MSGGSKIPKGWVETTLGEVVDKMYSGGTPSTKRDDYYNGDIPWIRTQEVIFNRINEADIHITELGLKNSSAKYIPINTVIVAMYGNSAGRVAISKIEATTNQACCNIISKPFVSKAEYIYYNILCRYEEIKGKANGAAQQNLSVGVLKELDICLPPFEEQQAIASILTTFDDKIELLQAQNQTLEATAQTIFKEWFGKYQVGDVLPEGWRVVELESFFDFLEGPGIRNWQYTDEGNRFINIRLIQNNDINVESANCVSIEEANGKYSHFQLKEKDFVLSTSGTLGRGAIVRKEHLPLLLNTSVIRFRPRDGYSYGYTYQFLQSRYFLHELESLASGSVQLNFGPMHLRQIVMVLPNEKTLRKYAERVNPLYDKMIQNLSQIQTLQQTRNTLLPKLMSGKLRVEEFKD